MIRGYKVYAFGASLANAALRSVGLFNRERPTIVLGFTPHQRALPRFAMAMNQEEFATYTGKQITLVINPVSTRLEVLEEASSQAAQLITKESDKVRPEGLDGRGALRFPCCRDDQGD